MRLIFQIFNIGIQHAQNDMQTKRIRLLNKLAFIAFVTCIVILSVLFILKEYPSAIVLGLVCIGYLGVFIFTSKGNYRIGSFYGLSIATLFSFFYGYVGGSEIGSQLFYPLVIIAAFTLYSADDKKLLYTTIFFILILYVLNEFIFCNGYALSDVPPRIARILNYFHKILNLGLSMLFLNALIKENRLFEKSLIKKNTTLKKTSTSLEKKKEEVEKHKNQLEKALKVKSDLLSNVSHEIRTPLNAIIGFSDIIMEDEEYPEKFDPQLKNINKASKSLLSLVNDILNLSKMENEQFELNMEPFSIRKKILEAKQFIEPATDKKDLTIETVIAPDLHDWVIGDRIRFLQLILNLVTNAAKFTASGSITISADTIKKKDTMHFYRFIIKDTGIGIDEQYLDTIFESFSQIQPYINKEYEGTGLGLNICQKIVHLMNGTIKVKSKKGIGSEFIVDVPFTITHEFKRSPQHKIDLSFIENKKLKILIVEDNEMNQQLLIQLLKKLNGITSVASNGNQAIEFLAKTTFDLVLLDLQMPLMNGFEVFEQFKSMKKGGDTKFIAVTADIFDETKNKVSELGFDDFMTKPINKDILYQKINNLFLSDE